MSLYARNLISSCPAANRTAANLLMGYYEFGPDHFGTAANTTGDPEDPVELYASGYAMISAPERAIIESLAAGILPLLPSWMAWGEEGLPSEAEAIATAETIESDYAENVDAVAHLTAYLAARGMQLIQWPT